MPSATEKFLFMPGSEPGPYCTGFADNAGIMRMIARRLKIGHVPVGSQVAAAFPWMRLVQWDVNAGSPPGVLRRDPWDYTFANNTARPIPVHELRIYAGRGAPLAFPAGWDTDLQIKVSIPSRRQIIERWMPWKAINTDPDSFVDGYLNQYAFNLPAPYFLSRSNTFQFDVLYSANLIGAGGSNVEEMFYVTLNGWGIEDGEPIQLVKPVLSWAAAPPNTNAFQTFTFDEDRDQPMRDAFISHVGFGGGQIGNNLNVLEQQRVRLQPPEGPKWHQDEFFPIASLAEQLGSHGAATNPTPCAIHRPITPYVLNPGESMVVEVVHRDYEAATQNYHLDVSVMGTQEGTLDLDALWGPKPAQPPDDETLIRAVVRPCPEIKYIADRHVTLQCWVNEKNMDGSENSPVSIRRLPVGRALDDRDWAGRELPYNERVPVRLEPGDRLYAITKDEALMSMSVEPME